MSSSSSCCCSMKCSKIPAIIIYGILICVGFACRLFSVTAIIPISIVCTIPLIYLISYSCNKKNENNNIDNEESKLILSTETSSNNKEEELLTPTSSIISPTTTKKKRHYYFDNLKVFLTVIVVVHHTACAFVGTSWFYGLGNFDGNTFKFFGNATLLLNQSYFMSLFFFISGYFIPPSYDKKTEYEFMLNKSKRLGIPFYLFSCIVNPLLIFTLIFAYNNGEYKGGELTYTYAFMPGVAWYIAWLFLFSTLYTTIRKDNNISIPTKPTLSKCLCYGFIVGMIQLFILMGFPTVTSLGMMPITWGSLPMDILFFIAGIYAKRGNWLDVNQETTQPQTIFITPTERTFVRIFTIFCIITSYVAAYLMFEAKITGPKETYGVWALLSGPYAITMSVCLIDLFQQNFNYKTERTAFFSKSAYMVYLFHPWVLVTFTFVYNYILKHVCNIIVEFENHSFASTTPIPSEYIWIGFFSVGIITQIVVWPLSFYLRQLPGLRSVM